MLSKRNKEEAERAVKIQKREASWKARIVNRRKKGEIEWYAAAKVISSPVKGTDVYRIYDMSRLKQLLIL